MSFAALCRMLDTYSADRLALYWDRATPKQMAFHKSQSARRLLRAANQVGKSFSGSAEAWANATGSHPYRETPAAPCVGWILVADLENHYPTICRKLRETEPGPMLSDATTYDTARGYRTRGRKAIELKNGSLVEFRSGKGEIVALASASVSWLWVDEVPRVEHMGEALSRVAVRRLPSGARAPVWMTFTPIGRPVDWLKKMVEGTDDEPPTEEWEQVVIRLTPQDCPHRSPESIREQAAGYLPGEYDQRVNGAWEGVTTERLFTGWGPSRLLHDKDLPSHEVRIGMSWDHGEHAGREVCLLYAYDEEERRAWVLDECASPGRTTIDQDAMQALEMLERNGLTLASVDRLHGDVNSAGKGASHLTSVNRMLEQALARCLGMPPSRPPVTIRSARKGPGSRLLGARVVNLALLSGRLLVSPKCEHLIQGLSHYRGGTTGKDAEISHALDALRYGLVSVLDPRAQGAQRLAVR